MEEQRDGQESIKLLQPAHTSPQPAAPWPCFALIGLCARSATVAAWTSPAGICPGATAKRGAITALTTLAASETAAASSFNTAMDHVAQGFEALGALILVVGVLSSFVLAGLAWRQPGSSKRAYTVLRQAFGGTLLLALEILVAADLIRTVAVSPTLDNVLVLGLIVLIRTFLSFSLEVEIEGALPWRRAVASGAGTIKRAAQTALGPDRR